MLFLTLLSLFACLVTVSRTTSPTDGIMPAATGAKYDIGSLGQLSLGAKSHQGSLVCLGRNTRAAARGCRAAGGPEVSGTRLRPEVSDEGQRGAHTSSHWLSQSPVFCYGGKNTNG